LATIRIRRHVFPNPARQLEALDTYPMTPLLRMTGPSINESTGGHLPYFETSASPAGVFVFTTTSEDEIGFALQP
jgi:hypothetical protein